MNIIVTDNGFTTDDWYGDFYEVENLPETAENVGIELPGDADLNRLTGHLHRFTMVRVTFPSFADGRGFTVARLLRMMGYQGRLRATGQLISDQYAMARRSGFDEIEISSDLAQRQPENEWLFRAEWQQNDYQQRLGRIY